MVTRTVSFPSIERRQSVRESLNAHAAVRDEEQEAEIRILFNLSQSLGKIENSESALSPNNPIVGGEPGTYHELTVPFTFDSQDALAKTIEFLESRDDADLNWLGTQLSNQ